MHDFSIISLAIFFTLPRTARRGMWIVAEEAVIPSSENVSTYIYIYTHIRTQTCLLCAYIFVKAWRQTFLFIKNIIPHATYVLLRRNQIYQH